MAGSPAVDRTLFVAVLMGSDSDLPILEPALDVLDAFGIRYGARLRSAHRTPAAAHAYVRDAEARGCAVFIAAAAWPRTSRARWPPSPSRARSPKMDRFQ